MSLQPESVRAISDSQFSYEDWGLISYTEALRRQEDLVTRVFEKRSPETIVFCSHPPVVTLGRGTKPGDVSSWDGEIVEVSRGGRATYHGPNQLVIYPIINLSRFNRDLHLYLRKFEEVLSTVLQNLGVEASGRGPEGDATGVWVGDRKIASIGIAVRKWISYHGAALNLYKDEKAFRGINPCGFSTNTMISLDQFVDGDNRFFIQECITSEINRSW